jgi:outer membrane protein assembly factor BamD
MIHRRSKVAAATCWRTLGLVMLVLLVAGCASHGGGKEAAVQAGPEALYQEAMAALRSYDYSRAVEQLNALEARYPFGLHAQFAQLNLIYANYRLGEREAAMAAAERFIKEHPRSPYLPYAYYMKGVVRFDDAVGYVERNAPGFLGLEGTERDPTPALESFAAFQELLQRFPNTEYTDDALLRMQFLKNRLAEHDLAIARYYFKRGAYVAVARRTAEIVRLYQGTPSCIQALALMAEAYRKMGMTKAEREARAILMASGFRGS